jgi:hypothetical protein
LSPLEISFHQLNTMGCFSVWYNTPYYEEQFKEYSCKR